jgi:hypothetical protein
MIAPDCEGNSRILYCCVSRADVSLSTDTPVNVRPKSLIGSPILGDSTPPPVKVGVLTQDAHYYGFRDSLFHRSSLNLSSLILE